MFSATRFASKLKVKLDLLIARLEYPVISIAPPLFPNAVLFLITQSRMVTEDSSASTALPAVSK